MHTLITGDIGVGKSTLIRKLLERVDGPVYGFRTLKQPPEADGYSRVYIHPAAGALRCSTENRVGICAPGAGNRFPAVFDAVGVPLLTGIPAGAYVLMDELGVMETDARAFCRAVLDVLDGNYRVIAAVKPKDTPFLQAVRSHPGARLYHIDAHNRDTLAQEVLRELGLV